MIEKIALYLFLWLGTRILEFKHLDMKLDRSGDDEDAQVEAITFSHSKEYIEKVAEIE